MSQMTDEEYVSHEGAICPFCRSPEVETAGRLESDGSIVWQPCKCASCKKEWTDQYKLVGYDPVT